MMALFVWSFSISGAFASRRILKTVFQRDPPEQLFYGIPSARQFQNSILGESKRLELINCPQSSKPSPGALLREAWEERLGAAHMKTDWHWQAEDYSLIHPWLLF